MEIEVVQWWHISLLYLILASLKTDNIIHIMLCDAISIRMQLLYDPDMTLVQNYTVLFTREPPSEGPARVWMLCPNHIAFRLSLDHPCNSGPMSYQSRIKVSLVLWYETSLVYQTPIEGSKEVPKIGLTKFWLYHGSSYHLSKEMDRLYIS